MLGAVQLYAQTEDPNSLLDYQLNRAEKTNWDSVKAYINAGAEVDVKDKDGFPLIMLAAAANQLEVVKLLVQKKADVNAVNEEYGTTAIFGAYENIAIANLLLQNGADINHQNNNGETPLMAGVKNKNIAFIKWLLENKAKVNISDNNNETALTKAKDLEGKEKPLIIALLKKYGAK